MSLRAACNYRPPAAGACNGRTEYIVTTAGVNLRCFKYFPLISFQSDWLSDTTKVNKRVSESVTSLYTRVSLFSEVNLSAVVLVAMCSFLIRNCSHIAILFLLSRKNNSKINEIIIFISSFVQNKIAKVQHDNHNCHNCNFTYYRRFAAFSDVWPTYTASCHSSSAIRLWFVLSKFCPSTIDCWYHSDCLHDLLDCLSDF